MSEIEQGYDPDAIRALLLAGCTSEGLRRLFLFSPKPDLRSVAEALSTADGLGVTVEKAMAHCQERALLSDLLDEVRHENPRQYARFGPYLRLEAKEKRGQSPEAEPHFEGAKLRGADLRKADLCLTRFCQADLRGAELRGADLSGAKLDGADLSGADMSGANLCSADLRGANLSGANLEGANLEGAKLAGTILDASTQMGAKWRLVCEISSQGAADRDLGQADLRRANLEHVDLRRADLRGADLRGARLQGARLTDAILDSSSQMDDRWRLVWEISSQGAANRDLDGATLRGANLWGATCAGPSYRGPICGIPTCARPGSVERT